MNNELAVYWAIIMIWGVRGSFAFVNDFVKLYDKFFQKAGGREK